MWLVSYAADKPLKKFFGDYITDNNYKIQCQIYRHYISSTKRKLLQSNNFFFKWISPIRYSIEDKLTHLHKRMKFK